MTEVGLCLPQLGPHVTADVVRRFCQRGEAIGFTSFWVQEHLFYPLEGKSGYAGRPGLPIPVPYQHMLASTELLTAAAAWTERALLGTSILVAGYHRPVELAQRLATIDVLSGGRLVVGLGLGWSEDEHDQMNVEFATKGARLEELVAALEACWADGEVEFHGRFFDIPRCLIQPKPIQRPRPPLISGLWGPRGQERTPRLFDGWNPAGLTVEQSGAIMAGMNAARPAGTAPMSMWYRLFLQAPTGADRPDQLLDTCVEARAAGFEHLIVDANFWPGITSPEGWLDALELMAPVVPL